MISRSETERMFVEESECGSFVTGVRLIWDGVTGCVDG